PGGVGLGAALQDPVGGGAAGEVVPGLLLGGEGGGVERCGGVMGAVADEHLERAPALGLRRLAGPSRNRRVLEGGEQGVDAVELLGIDRGLAGGGDGLLPGGVGLSAEIDRGVALGEEPGLPRREALVLELGGGDAGLVPGV